jgi:hypothetical protein
LGACVICRRPQKREVVVAKISNIRIGRSPIFGIYETLQTEQTHRQNTCDNNMISKTEVIANTHNLENRLGADDVQANELVVEVADATDGDVA